MEHHGILSDAQKRARIQALLASAGPDARARVDRLNSGRKQDHASDPTTLSLQIEILERGQR